MVPSDGSLGRPVAALGLILATLGTSRAASAAPPAAPEKQACVNAATRGQIQRDDQKLHSAAEAFEICAQPSCPAAVKQSCTTWLAEVKALFPTIAVHVATPPARLVVKIDGAEVELDKPLETEPGPHHVEASAEGKVPVERNVVVKAGEVKVVEIELVDPPPPPRKIRPIPPATWISGGVALAGFATFAVFGVFAKSEVDSLKDDCAPGCTEDQRDGAFTTALVADIGLGVGVLATAAAAYFYFTRPTKTAPVGGLPSLRFSGTGLRGTF